MLYVCALITTHSPVLPFSSFPACSFLSSADWHSPNSPLIYPAIHLLWYIFMSLPPLAYLFAHPSVLPSICSSSHSSVYSSNHHSIYPSTRPFTHPPTCPFTPTQPVAHLPMHPFIHPPAHLLIHLPTQLLIHLPKHLLCHPPILYPPSY